MFTRIKRIFRSIRRQRRFRMYVMTVESPSEYTGNIYPKSLVERELTTRPYPFLMQFGGTDHVAYRGLYPGSDYPIFEIDIRHAAAHVLDFEFEGNDLYAMVEFMDTPAGNAAVDLVWKLGPDALRCAPIGDGNVTDCVVQDDYRLVAFELKLK